MAFDVRICVMLTAVFAFGQRLSYYGCHVAGVGKRERVALSEAVEAGPKTLRGSLMSERVRL